MCAEVRECKRTSKFEVGESSRANKEPRVPIFVQMGEDEVYMNFPNSFAFAEVRE